MLQSNNCRLSLLAALQCPNTNICEAGLSCISYELHKPSSFDSARGIVSIHWFDDRECFLHGVKPWLCVLGDNIVRDTRKSVSAAFEPVTANCSTTKTVRIRISWLASIGGLAASVTSLSCDSDASSAGGGMAERWPLNDRRSCCEGIVEGIVCGEAIKY